MKQRYVRSSAIVLAREYLEKNVVDAQHNEAGRAAELSAIAGEIRNSIQGITLVKLVPGSWMIRVGGTPEALQKIAAYSRQHCLEYLPNQDSHAA